mmetsp:Transcript_5969/g.8701  ORF Transcript_5969/g.8701 Transcript_5969/m.8701 type:complete len:114 (-) Transcript_5969:974-1315(-)
MRAGDQLMELCERVSEGFPPVVAREFLSYTYKFKGAAPYPFLQVGDKKIFAERYRWLLAAHGRKLYFGVDDEEEVWQENRKMLEQHKSLAIINCGRLEEKGGTEGSVISAVLV